MPGIGLQDKSTILNDTNTVIFIRCKKISPATAIATGVERDIASVGPCACVVCQRCFHVDLTADLRPKVRVIVRIVRGQRARVGME